MTPLSSRREPQAGFKSGEGARGGSPRPVTDETGEKETIMMEKFNMCGNCDHFVTENEAYTGQKGIAPFDHLDDGDKEHDHEAMPVGRPMSIEYWRALRPRLFVAFPDGKIGPNSKHYTVTQ